MSQSNGMFSSSSLQTFIAASFILALFAMGVGVYNFTRTNQAVSAILDLQVETLAVARPADDGAELAALRSELAALTARLDAVEAAPPAADAGDAAPPAQ